MISFPVNPSFGDTYTAQDTTYVFAGANGWWRKEVGPSNETPHLLNDYPRWSDIDLPIIIRTTGPNIPTLATLQDPIQAPLWAVNDFTVCEGVELPHSWQEGSLIQWHCHVITGGSDTTDRYIKMELIWTFGQVGQQLVPNITTTSSDLLIPAGTPDRTHIPFNIGAPVPMTNVKIGTHVYARLRRIAATGAAPTADVFIPMLQIHAQMDSSGSRFITQK